MSRTERTWRYGITCSSKVEKKEGKERRFRNWERKMDDIGIAEKV